MNHRDKLLRVGAYLDNRNFKLDAPGFDALSNRVAVSFGPELEDAFDPSGALRKPIESASWNEDARAEVQWAFGRAELNVHHPRYSDEGPIVLDPRRLGADSDLVRLGRAFHVLRRQGLIAEGALGFTSSEGWETVEERTDEDTQGAVFWNYQGHDAFDADGNLTAELMLQWRGPLEDILAALEAEGFKFARPRSEREAIWVQNPAVAAEREELLGRVRETGGLLEVFSAPEEPEAPMSRRGAIYATSYLMALADGSASPDELAAINHFLDELAPVEGSRARASDELVQLTMDTVFARKDVEPLIGRIVSALPDPEHRGIAFFVACVAAFADGEVASGEEALLVKLSDAFGFSAADRLALMKKVAEVLA